MKELTPNPVLQKVVLKEVHRGCAVAIEAQMKEVDRLKQELSLCKKMVGSALGFLGPINYHIKDDRSGQHIKHYLDCATDKLESVSEKTHWNKPDSIPVVGLGKEKKFWIAVECNGEYSVRDAFYQNRPALDENGELNDFALSEGVDSVQWVDNKSHYDFDDFYVPISFSEHCVLVGWAEWSAPEFTGGKLS